MTYRFEANGVIPSPMRLEFLDGSLQVTEWPKVQPQTGLWESYGICSHPNFDGVYLDPDAWTQRVADLGAYAFRGMFAANLPRVQRTLERAKELGLKWLAQVATETGPSDAQLRERLDLIAANPDVFIGIEGINEPDADRLTDVEITRTVNVQRIIWNYVQDNGLNVTVLSPALRRPAGPTLYQRFADAGLLGLFDAVSLHHYGKAGMIHPTELATHIDMVQGLWQCDRFWVTETGSTNATASTDPRRCTEAESAAYAVRNILDLLDDPRVDRVFRYELLDDAGPLTNNEAHFGLWRSDGTPKPEVGVVRDFLASVRRDGGEVELEVTAPEDVRSCVAGSSVWLHRPAVPWDAAPVEVKVATPAREQTVQVGGTALEVPLEV